MKRIKRIKRKLAIMLAVVMVMGMQSVTVLAEENEDDTITETAVDTVGMEKDVEPELDVEVEANAENGQQENDKMDTEEKNIETDTDVESAGIEIYAAEDVVASGTCGDNLTWALTEDGAMTISGTGDMWDYDSESGMNPSFTMQYSEQIKRVIIESGITGIGDYAFSYCHGLIQIEIPEGISRIGNGAFVWCEQLESILIPDSVTSIGKDAFSYCESLREIKMSDSVSDIGDGAFSDCHSLVNVRLPEGITRIGEGTFYKCGLQDILIPENVTSIGSNAFEQCYSLKNVIFAGNAPAFGEAPAFLFVTADIYYPANNPTWTAEKMQNYGGTLTWVPWNLYIVEEATDSVYVKGSSNGATIKCTEELGKFISGAVDGLVVDSSNYTVVEGSTVLMFLSAYLDTLSVGDHVVTLNYTYGSVDTTLTVIDNASNVVDSNTPGNVNGTNTTGNVTNTMQNSLTQSGVPKTGDNSLMMLWMVFTVIAGGSCLAVVWTRKRRAI